MSGSEPSARLKCMSKSSERPSDALKSSNSKGYLRGIIRSRSLKGRAMHLMNITTRTILMKMMGLQTRYR